MRGSYRLAWGVVIAGTLGGSLPAARSQDRRQLERIQQALEREGEAVVALAAGESRTVAGGFSLTWRHDVFKADRGTFVPFIVGITPSERPARAALVYVRLARRAGEPDKRSRQARVEPGEDPGYAFEEIYPVELAPGTGAQTRLVRGMSVEPGEYDLTIAVRERDRDDRRSRGRLEAVLRQRLSVPDFSSGALATSTIILADRVTVLPQVPGSRAQPDHPYVVGSQEIEPAADSVFARNQELIVVLLVYNPTVTGQKLFDLQVEYHFFRTRVGASPGVTSPGPAGPVAKPGEVYVNRTEPQRFNPVVLGPGFTAADGQPVMAGQGVPLAGFQEGDYRLVITVTDLVSGRSIERDVTFTVRS
jgi:hypothetical protein